LWPCPGAEHEVYQEMFAAGVWIRFYGDFEVTMSIGSIDPLTGVWKPSAPAEGRQGDPAIPSRQRCSWIGGGQHPEPQIRGYDGDVTGSVAGPETRNYTASESARRRVLA
jgi:hypothetical protein